MKLTFFRRPAFSLILVAIFSTITYTFTQHNAEETQPTVDALFNPRYNYPIEKPASVDELINTVESASKNNKKISIFGAGKSTGGQTHARDSIQIDMSQLNRILAIDPVEKTITVQAGITWHKIQTALDPLGLSVMVMQSYADFSVGGSISVNVHGQDIVFGAIGNTIKSMKVLTADSTLVTCSPTENKELFSYVIGGYGLFGIITEVTLHLTNNCTLKRASYIHHADTIFEKSLELLKQPDMRLFSSRLKVSESGLYKKSLTIVYTEEPNIEPEKLYEASALRTALERAYFYGLRKVPFLKRLRLLLGKGYFERTGTTTSRNNMMHGSIASLEWDKPSSRDLLQEYFIPVKHADKFLEKARVILKKYHNNTVNTSIRYVHQDNHSFLTYAHTDSFAFVLYIHIKENKKSYIKTQKWTRELIDAAISCNGTFYLPYQRLATKKQLLASYPQWNKFIELKKLYDPNERFVNELYLHYA